MTTTDDERIGSLRAIPLFRELNDGILRRVLERASEFDVRRGHVLIERDRPGQGLFLIEEGTAVVELQQRNIDVGPGDFVGELALLTESGVHVARVAATSELRGLAIRRDDFEDLLREEPELALAVLRALAQRLAERAAT